MARLTREQIRDLRAVKKHPGIYSEMPPNKPDSIAFHDLVRDGLLRWRKSGGYEITLTGRRALQEGGGDGK